MSKKNSVLTSLACFLGIPALAIMLMFNCIARGRIPPMYYPKDWGAYVWVSEKPRAFITYDTEYGGQMEIDGEMCNIHFTINYDWSLIFEKIDDAFFMEKNGRAYLDDSREGQFHGKTTYKEDSIICKGDRNSKNYARQKIVFTRYAKDEVSPADLGFELESWDGFVPDWLVEARSRRNTPEPTPAPTPEPTPLPTPEYVHVKAGRAKRVRHFMLCSAFTLSRSPFPQAARARPRTGTALREAASA